MYTLNAASVSPYEISKTDVSPEADTTSKVGMPLTLRPKSRTTTEAAVPLEERVVVPLDA